MRIVIDMQGSQSESRFRGIGRYTMDFARAVVRNRGEHEIILALSGLFPDSIEPIRAAFDGILPQENIRVWYAMGPVKEVEPGNGTRREVAELVREAFLESLCPDVIHVTSLFEGYVDDAVTSIGKLDSRAPVSVILYDLIPLLNPDQYLKLNQNYATYYERKLKSLKQAALYLAISDHAKQEGLDCLGVDPERIENISTAFSPEFQVVKIDASTSNKLCNRLGLTKPFVLYTGGADERKNLARLIEAWAKLPAVLRQEHQLLLAGRMPDRNVEELRHIAMRCGLQNDELLFSGYVSDEELVQLYNLCKLYVFPSWHEGFGLPALEAMACGAAVIGANTSSLPEVIGLECALFDPFDVSAIRDKVVDALGSEAFLATLRSHGLTQTKRFSWDKTAQRAIAAWKNLVKVSETADDIPAIAPLERNRLIDAIAPHLGNADEQTLAVLAAQIAQNECAGLQRQLLLDVSELCQRDSATGVQRVVRSYLYHLLHNPPRGFRVMPVYATQTEGYRYASTFAARMLGISAPVAEDAPMHWQRGDIFFGLDMQHHVQLAHSSLFVRLRQDGVVVKFMVYDLLPIQLAEFFKDSNAKELHEKWLTMIAMQDEAICISKATVDAYEEWLQKNMGMKATGFSLDWVHMGADLEGSKPSRGLPKDAAETLHLLKARPSFLSVSTLEPRKAQVQILDAIEVLWARGQDVNLVMVGTQGWKVESLVERIINHPENGKRLFWLKGISDEYLGRVYQACTCLVAASINEGFGLPLIEAARHNMPIIARDNPVFREVAGNFAYYFTGDSGLQLAQSMSDWLELHHVGKAPASSGMGWLSWKESSERLKAALVERNYPRRQLLVDISELVQRDARTGIQRVVRSILNEWIRVPNCHFKIEAVYATAEQGYRYARKFMAHFMGLDSDQCSDDMVEFSPGDVFLGLDLAPGVVPFKIDIYKKIRIDGVLVAFVVYDLLPLMDGYFEKGHAEACVRWLDVATSGDMAICISQSVSAELIAWMECNKPEKLAKMKISSFHLGADIDSSIPSIGLPKSAVSIISEIKSRPSFLMVSTIAPHKGHAQVLGAFENLWAAGVNVNLVVVGKQGWMVDELCDRLRKHPEFGSKFYWLEGISDEYLIEVYSASSCLVVASYGEGFGLPLIEAAQKKLPIMARDIPVFREVAGEYAEYFNADTPEQLAQAIQAWLLRYEQGTTCSSENMPWLTWQQSAQQLLSKVLS